MSHIKKYQTVSEIIERIKDIISSEIDGKVQDYHVADALNMKRNTLKMDKRDNRIPYDELLKFCYGRDIDIYELLY